MGSVCRDVAKTETTYGLLIYSSNLLNSKFNVKIIIDYRGVIFIL